jgi:hypothetical protein
MLSQMGFATLIATQGGINRDQIDNSIADAGRWHGNRNYGNRSAGLVAGL